MQETIANVGRRRTGTRGKFLSANTPIHFECRGHVRGWCGHKHRKPEAAEKCIKRDNRGCKKRCGRNAYSDRYPYGYDATGFMIGVARIDFETENKVATFDKP